MQKTWMLIIAVAALIAALCFIGCNEDSEETEEDDNSRPQCTQATDCGPEGRSIWVCSPEGYCYSIKEYCYEDEECVGACVDHLCEGGKVEEMEDGDAPLEDGDEDAEEAGQQPCEYECCSDEDCPEGNICDTDNHICVLLIPCDQECCQDYDCQVNPEFPDHYICRFNKCVDPDAPCDLDCCSQQDCLDKYGEGYICDQGTCRYDQIRCTPDFIQCCTDDPGNPDCLALGPLLTEAILTCNATGDGWDVSMCDPFNDCISFGDGVDYECFPNGRCEVDDDCPCPQICAEVETGKLCKVPTVGPDELCAADACGTGESIPIARCPAEYVCCIGINQDQPENGFCTLDGNCAK